MVNGFILYKVKPKHKKNSQWYMRILCCTPSHKLRLDGKLFILILQLLKHSIPYLNLLGKVFTALYFIICQSTFSRGLPTSGTYHSFHLYVQNATIPCHSQDLLPFLCYISFPSTLFHQLSSILSHLILPSVSWSTSQPCCFQIHI